MNIIELFLSLFGGMCIWWFLCGFFGAWRDKIKRSTDGKANAKIE